MCVQGLKLHKRAESKLKNRLKTLRLKFLIFWKIKQEKKEISAGQEISRRSSEGFKADGGFINLSRQYADQRER